MDPTNRCFRLGVPLGPFEPSGLVRGQASLCDLIAGALLLAVLLGAPQIALVVHGLLEFPPYHVLPM